MLQEVCQPKAWVLQDPCGLPVEEKEGLGVSHGSRLPYLARIEHVDHIYPKVPLEPHDVTVGSMEHLGRLPVWR